MKQNEIKLFKIIFTNLFGRNIVRSLIHIIHKNNFNISWAEKTTKVLKEKRREYNLVKGKTLNIM